MYKTLQQFGKVKVNAALGKLTTFEIGGPADFLVKVETQEKLVGLLNYLSGEGVDFLILGGGCNILLPDEGWRGVVIKVESRKSKVSAQGGSGESQTIEVEAGMDLSKLVELTIQNNLTGLEWAAGIPGTVGGAIRGNAGAHYVFTGGEVKDSIETVLVWRDGEVFEFSGAECGFGYRDSIFKHNKDVILSGRFKLRPGNAKESLLMTQKIIAERKGKQSAAPSAGSFFKNLPLESWPRDLGELPERFIRYKKIAAGWLVEQAGLKGFQVGDAMVSLEHGNFIINKGNATQADVLAVVEEVKARVYTKFGVELEEEVCVVGTATGVFSTV
ncbi:MAG: UDP-N-acetylenolpyruvoylglucosamine reductase [Candidatus Magasanikbacteria bacterium RIFCSPHIGHO2_01_FULL_47_8]|uniref:UDP-N-acetylenolpyruvoylglucosamine reductase n=1 Tax=Candidatus Magasanikbacteria bacterium RIFCSPHIGHO2_01_FULL_47_8 TaxID=1798673 RepID=A0A1F6MD89_9BACT|nr:MAG: UDP-N-acetylenolpyruvoylglucosamine reductase [Candidatus Magasanikbacteria bacterium RIFCSPHIGHO2_01_FULL_47_8]